MYLYLFRWSFRAFEMANVQDGVWFRNIDISTVRASMFTNLLLWKKTIHYALFYYLCWIGSGVNPYWRVGDDWVEQGAAGVKNFRVHEIGRGKRSLHGSMDLYFQLQEQAQGNTDAAQLGNTEAAQGSIDRVQENTEQAVEVRDKRGKKTSGSKKRLQNK